MRNRVLVDMAGAELRAVVGAEPTAPHASKGGNFAGIQVTLSRSGDRWALTLEGEVTPELAAAWAQAVGVPAPDWWKTNEGRRWRCDWQEKVGS